MLSEILDLDIWNLHCLQDHLKSFSTETEKVLPQCTGLSLDPKQADQTKDRVLVRALWTK